MSHLFYFIFQQIYFEIFLFVAVQQPSNKVKELQQPVHGTAVDNQSDVDANKSFDSKDDTLLAVVKETLSKEPIPAQPNKGKLYFKTTRHGLKNQRSAPENFPVTNASSLAPAKGN